MKRKFTRVAAVLCGMSLLLTGCRIGNKNIVVSNILNDRQVFKIEGTVCSLKEARVYLTNYQNIYGTAYGVDLWKHDFGVIHGKIYQSGHNGRINPGGQHGSACTVKGSCTFRG